MNYGDNVDNSGAVSALHDLLLAEHQNYLELDLHDLTAEEAVILDTRIHCVLYLLAPHSFSVLDAKFIEQISPLAPVVPVVSKADAMSDQERDAFLLKVRAKIDAISEDLGQPVIYNFHPPAEATQDALKADPGSIFATICEDSSDERVYLWGKPGEAWRPSDLGSLQECLLESDAHLGGLVRSTHQKTISLLRMRRAQQEQQRAEAEAIARRQEEERRMLEAAQRQAEEARLASDNAVIAKRSQSFSYYFSRSQSNKAATAATTRGSASARSTLTSAAGSPLSSTDNPLSPLPAGASQSSASKKDCVIQ